MRQRFCRFETDLAVFGQAFKEATWEERLGVVNAIALMNKIEAIKEEVEEVSRNIDKLEDARMTAGEKS